VVSPPLPIAVASTASRPPGENSQLKRLVADKELENLGLREIARGNW